jgi:hypothetical protein
MKERKGQVLMIVAVLFVVVLLIMSVLINSGLLLLDKQELNRVSAAGGRSGLVYVGNLMVTQAGEAYRATAQAPGTKTYGFPVTPSAPQDADRAWKVEHLSEQERATLISPPVRTLVAGKVKDQLEWSGVVAGKDGILKVEIIYPFQYHPEKDHLDILVRVSKRVQGLFSGFLEIEGGILTGESRQSIK